MRYFSLIGLPLFLFLCPFGLQATVIHVPGDSTTIQGGINGATAGDTVMVSPGTYYEYEIDFFGKSITVMGTDPEDSVVVAETIVDANAMGSVFTFHSGEDSSSILAGLTITDGSAIAGGGIYFDSSSPLVSRCNIIENEAVDSSRPNGGGGIFCRNASPIIRNCWIQWNVAPRGGGVKCTNASPSFRGCIISDNSTTHSSGGGMNLSESSDLVIRDCRILRNISGYGAGGILCSASSPLIEDCFIIGNIASYEGGGLFSRESLAEPMIINCTIADNSAVVAGGMACVSFTEPTITNCIFWGNDPVEIGSRVSANPIVTYSDIRGGWPGLGNIDADPLFADPSSYDYCLLEGSPCIDAGDPLSPLDPDGTRADMGACYFDQGPLGELSLVVVPDTTYFQRGDSLCFTAMITNNTDSTIFFQGWTESETPWGTLVTPLLGPVPWVLGPQETISPYICRQQIPNGAPFGSPYTYIVKAGSYPKPVIAEDSFEFSIVPPTPVP